MFRLRKLLLCLGVLGLGLLGCALPASAVQRPQPPRPPHRGQVCTHPVWSSTGPGGTRSGPGIYHPGNSDYIVDNDMWNATGNDVSQTLNVCSYHSWYVDDTIPAGTSTAVKTYPNVHVDYRNWVTGYQPPLSRYPRITSTYAGHGPNAGIYEYAYDIWLNGVGTPGSSEVMIWTDNHGQTPGGSLVASNVEISGRRWDVWARSGNSYVAFVPSGGRAYPSGTLTLTDFFHYLIHGGELASTSTLGQICYGIEVVSTGGGTVRYDVTNFRVTPAHRAIEG